MSENANAKNNMTKKITSLATISDNSVTPNKKNFFCPHQIARRIVYMLVAMIAGMNMSKIRIVRGSVKICAIGPCREKTSNIIAADSVSAMINPLDMIPRIRAGLLSLGNDETWREITKGRPLAIAVRKTKKNEKAIW